MPNDSIIDTLRARVEESKRELDKIIHTIQELNDKASSLKDDVQGYERALAAEERRVNPMRADREPVEEPREAGAPETAETSIGPSTINKTETIRTIVRDNPGITPGRVFAALTDRKIRVHRNYVYSVLGRLKEAGKIYVNASGQYFMPGRADGDDSDVPEFQEDQRPIAVQ